MARELIAIVGFSALAVLVLGWLVVSFSAPSRRRTVIEWVSACAMYTALVSLFTNLVVRASDSGSTAGLIGFGFMLALFGSGLVVCLVQTLLTLRGGTRETTNATH